MPKVSPIQTSFNGGETSPLMHGRVDFEKYKSSLKTSFNGISLVQGPWTRRPGTYFAAEVKSSSTATRVVKFEFSTTQAYIIEFGNLYMRFYRNNAPVTLTAQDITGATRTNPVVLTYSGSDTYANGDDVEISGVGGMVELNGRRFRVAGVNTGANTFQLTDMQGNNVDGTNFGAYTSGGSVAEVYTVVTPYATADLAGLKFTQSADVLYVAHPSYAPRKITRTAHTAWTINTITFLDGPFLNVNATSTTLTLSSTSGSVTVTASSTTGINNDAGFHATNDIGRIFRWKDPANNWTWLTITAWTSTTVVTATISGPAASAGTATVNWRLGVWYVGAYPSCVTFYEDRLTWAGAASAPQRVDMSKSSDYENMAPTNAAGTVASDNAVAVTLNSKDVQVIRWIEDDEKGLAVGTVKGEWMVRPSTQNEALSPTNVKAVRATANGSADIQALRAGKAILYVQRAKRKLRELAYVFEADGFRSPDMTILAEHITETGIVALDYQQEPYSIVWAATTDGRLLPFTYDRDQNVLGWNDGALGGFSNSGHTTAPIVESVAVIPAADGVRDELWMVVKRYIDGGVKRYVEYMTKFWSDEMDQADAIFFDSALTYDSTATTTIRGLYHLRGETVSVIADGAAHPDVTVSATGSVTLTRSSSVVQIGYDYNSDGETLRWEAGAADGTAQGKIQRFHKVVFRLKDTLGMSVGKDFDNLDEFVFRTAADDTGTAVPLFTGDKPKTWDGGYGTESLICWRMNGGFPGTVLAIMPRLKTEDAG